MPQIKIDILKKRILESQLSLTDKQALLDVLPKLSNAVLRFANLEFSKTGESQFHQQAVKDAIIKSAVAYSGLAGSFKEATDLFLSSPQNPDFEFGQYLIPFALDVRSYLSKYSNPDLGNALEQFEAKTFQWLPSSELEQILNGNLLYFVANLPNIILELKRIYWLVDLNDDGTWVESLYLALEKNIEKLGQSNLIRDDKSYPPTVSNWLKDYLAFNNKPITERAAYDQVQYIERAPNVQRLNAYERKDLLEIIKLQAWLMNPEVTEAEVNAYEADLSKQHVAAPAKPLPAQVIPAIPEAKPKLPVTPAPPPQPKPVSPLDWVRTATQRRAEEQQKIESKIEELKKKVK